jgi:Iodothyronine deiodinase
MYKRYGDRVEFLGIYVREAHPTDGWPLPSNQKAGIALSQPTDLSERFAVAKKCCSLLKMTIPLLVDELDDRVGHAYSGMPDRLYLIDRDGRVAYKGGRGPMGFKPGELEQSVVMLLLDQETLKSPHATTAAVNRSEATRSGDDKAPATPRQRSLLPK